jgi:hypothetical protein
VDHENPVAALTANEQRRPASAGSISLLLSDNIGSDAVGRDSCDGGNDGPLLLDA